MSHESHTKRLWVNQRYTGGTSLNSFSSKTILRVIPLATLALLLVGLWTKMELILNLDLP